MAIVKDGSSNNVAVALQASAQQISAHVSKYAEVKLGDKDFINLFSDVEEDYFESSGDEQDRKKNN